MTKNKAIHEAIEGRVIYLLILVALGQFIYPITGDGSLFTATIYNLLVASWMVMGIVLARDHPVIRRILVGLGIIWLVGGTVYIFNPTEQWALLVGYLSISPFQIMVTVILLRFIFQSGTINRDVLYAASAVYLLLGAVFVPIFGLLETLQCGSFIDGGFTGVICRGDYVFPWQTFIYYSYATLTTLGYGDILPMTQWARAAATLEAIIGVLYITVIMARLVGLYAQEPEHSKKSL